MDKAEKRLAGELRTPQRPRRQTLGSAGADEVQSSGRKKSRASKSDTARTIDLGIGCFAMLF